MVIGRLGSRLCGSDDLSATSTPRGTATIEVCTTTQRSTRRCASRRTRSIHSMRMEAFAEIQRIMIEDAVHLPNYERGRVFVQVPQLKGVVHSGGRHRSGLHRTPISSRIPKRPAVLHLHPQARHSRHRHGLVHRHGDVRRDARRAGRSARQPARDDGADSAEPGSTIRARSSGDRAVRHLHRQHAERRLRHLVHAGEPPRQRHHLRELPCLRDARDSGGGLCRVRRRAVGRA